MQSIIISAANRLFPAIVMLLLVASCNRTAPPKAAAASAAYTDGFEVVVFELRDGAPTNARSVPLKDAELAIASGSQALIPGDPTAVQSQLSTGKSGDSRVSVSVQSLVEARQQVRVSLHESNRTFVYEYIVEGLNVRPVSSEYRDLGKSKVVRYMAQGN